MYTRNFRYLSSLMLVILCLSACAPATTPAPYQVTQTATAPQVTITATAAQAVPPTQTAPAIQEPSVTPEIPPTQTATQNAAVLLRLSLPHFTSAPPVETIKAQLLDESLTRARQDLEKSGTPVTTSLDLLRQLPMQDGCPGQLYPDFGIYEGYMLESVAAPTIITANNSQFVEPPSGVFQTAAFDPIQKTFTVNDQKFGAPAATAPMMIIYNPDILGTLPEPLTMDAFNAINAKHPIWVPPHGGVGMAILDGLFGDPLSMDSLLNASFYDSMLKFEAYYNTMRENHGTRGAQTPEILSGFLSGEVAWTFEPSTFLALLAQNNYLGKVAISPMPQVNHFAGSAMSLAWVVPQNAKDPALAWALIGDLSKDPQMVRYFLYDGLLPASPAGFALLEKDPTLMNGALPDYLTQESQRDQTIKQLSNIASQSPAWHIPQGLSIDDYNKTFLPQGQQLILDIANGKLDLPTANKNLYNTLKSLVH